MKKSKIKLLTATACLALVGTASAAWVYAGTATASANIGVKVASYASAGTITVSDTSEIKVVLDNKSVYYLDGNDEVTATYKKPSGVDTSGKNVTLSYTISLSDDLKALIGFGDTIGSVVTTDTTGTWTSGVAITLPSLAWQTDKCPSDFEGYQGLLKDSSAGSETEDTGNLDGKDSYYLTVTFTATVSNS